MSVAYYIVTQQAPEDLDVFVNGKAIAHLDEETIEELCAAAGVMSLLDFISQNPEELEEFLEDEGIEADDETGFPEEAWFSPEQGLETVRGLMAHLRQNPQALNNTDDIMADLQEYESVLGELAAQKIAWHLALDF